MATFNCNNNASLVALTTTARTQIALIQTATGVSRSKVFELDFGPGSVPSNTDCEIIYDFLLKDATTAGTAGVALATQVAADGSGLVSQNKYALNYTAGNEPTTYSQTNGGIALGLNQRVSYRWVAFQQEDQITLSVTISQGGGFRAKSSNYTGNVICTLAWREM